MKNKKESPLTDAPEVQPAPVREEKPTEASVTPENAAEALEKVKAEYHATCKALAEVTVQRERLLNEVKHLRVLLAAFNALTREGDVKLEKPALNTPYWYIRAMPIAKSFEVVPCEWHDWKSDHYRYVQGNMFLDLYTANYACQELNAVLAEL